MRGAQRYDYYAFFEDRAQADTYVKGIVALMPERNVVIRTTKVSVSRYRRSEDLLTQLNTI